MKFTFQDLHNKKYTNTKQSVIVSEEGEEEMPAPQTTTDESSSNVIEFPDTDVKIGYDR